MGMVIYIWGKTYLCHHSTTNKYILNKYKDTAI